MPARLGAVYKDARKPWAGCTQSRGVGINHCVRDWHLQFSCLYSSPAHGLSTQCLCVVAVVTDPSKRQSGKRVTAQPGLRRTQETACVAHKYVQRVFQILIAARVL